MLKIGIFGGTFNPVHFGHLRIGLECAEALGLDELRMIPCGLPPHRTEPCATPEQRLKMLALATQGTSIVVDNLELEREGHSYTVDTLKSFHADYPDASFYLIIGSDSFQNILSWHNWQDILKLSNIIIAQRPDHSDDKASKAGVRLSDRFCSIEEVVTKNAGGIACISVTQLEISASKIRERIKQHRSVKFLLPDNVIKFIESNNLYNS